MLLDIEIGRCWAMRALTCKHSEWMLACPGLAAPLLQARKVQSPPAAVASECSSRKLTRKR